MNSLERSAWSLSFYWKSNAFETCLVRFSPTLLDTPVCSKPFPSSDVWVGCQIMCTPHPYNFETKFGRRCEGVRVPQSFQKLTGLRRISPNLDRRSPATPQELLSQWVWIRASEKPTNKRTHKQSFFGVVPGLSWDCPGIVPAFSRYLLGILFVCSPFAQEGTMSTNFTPTHSHSWDRPEKLFMFIGFFRPAIEEQSGVPQTSPGVPRTSPEVT